MNFAGEGGTNDEHGTEHRLHRHFFMKQKRRKQDGDDGIHITENGSDLRRKML